MLMKIKEEIIVGLLVAGVTFAGINIGKIDTKIELPDEKVVCYLYTHHCAKCGYELAEGDYSIVSEKGTRGCPECGYWFEYTINNGRIEVLEILNEGHK